MMYRHMGPKELEQVMADLKKWREEQKVSSTMPLERPRKPAGAFKRSARYPGSQNKIMPS